MKSVYMSSPCLVCIDLFVVIFTIFFFCYFRCDRFNRVHMHAKKIILKHLQSLSYSLSKGSSMCKSDYVRTDQMKGKRSQVTKVVQDCSRFTAELMLILTIHTFFWISITNSLPPRVFAVS